MELHALAKHGEWAVTEGESVVIKLPKAQALVLYDWVARLNETGQAGFDDQAEQVAVWFLEASLEPELVEVIRPDYRDRVSAARDEIRHGDD
jgi:hypothetical protein